MSEHDVAEKLRIMNLQHIQKVAVPRAKQIFVSVKKEGFKELIKLLKNEGFGHLSAITAVKSDSAIELLYHLIKNGIILTVRTRVYSDETTIPTITDIILGASLYEREIHDLFGVKFEGHPNLERLILPDDWPAEDYPLRKSRTVAKDKKRKETSEKAFKS